MNVPILRFGAALLLSCLALPAFAQVPPGYPGNYAEIVSGARQERKLVIYSTTDQAAANPLIKDFQTLYPNVSVEYNDMDSVEVYRRFIAESKDSVASADVLWSSAMDLQLKLVNDGFAQAYKSPEASAIPLWAVWRNEAFGTTYEPVVIVYNKRLLAADEVPQSHAGLTRLLRDKAERFKGKVTTYDIEKSGVGFLLATQDSKTSSAYWELARAMFATGPNLQSKTGPMMERIASGENLIGYNLVGSYAILRARKDPSIGYVLPRDYTLVMSRILFIAKQARHPNAARLWVDYILSRRGQEIIANQSQLFSIRPDVDGETTAVGLAKLLGSSLKPINVGPGLLTYQDQAKRLEFLRQWQLAAKKK